MQERRKQDEAAQVEHARAEAELKRIEEEARAAESARQQAIKEAHEKLEAAHFAEAKGRAAWEDLARVCEMVMAGEKIAAIRVAATAALAKAGRS
jgi:hypothetical protein